VNTALQVTGRVWRDGKVEAKDFELSRLSDYLAVPDTLVWADLVNPTPDELRQLADELELDPLAVEDALAPSERPKVTRHRTHLFFMTYWTELPESQHGADPGRGTLALSRVSGFVLPHGLVTVRLDDRLPMDRVVAQWEENSDLLTLGVGALVHGLLDVVVDGHFQTSQTMDDAMESLEDVLFEESAGGRALQRRMYALRKDLVSLRRVVLPMREVVNGLLRHRKEEQHELGSLYEDLYDHVLRVAEWTESLRDMVTTVFETHLSLQDARLNTVMKKLAGWAAIIAVPTAVTGWFGQNVPYPGFQAVSGLWMSAIAIAVLSVLLYLVFRVKGWL